MGRQLLYMHVVKISSVVFEHIINVIDSNTISQMLDTTSAHKSNYITSNRGPRFDCSYIDSCKPKILCLVNDLGPNFVRV
jgi:hypothetical protein